MGQATGLQYRVIISGTSYWESDRSGFKYDKFLTSPNLTFHIYKMRVKIPMSLGDKRAHDVRYLGHNRYSTNDCIYYWSLRVILNNCGHRNRVYQGLGHRSSVLIAFPQCVNQGKPWRLQRSVNSPSIGRTLGTWVHVHDREQGYVPGLYEIFNWTAGPCHGSSFLHLCCRIQYLGTLPNQEPPFLPWPSCYCWLFNSKFDRTNT